MEYLIKTCPKCSRELHIPKEMTSCICMYCGEKFQISAAVEETSGDLSEANREKIEMGYRNALENIPKLIEDYERLLLLFTKAKYSNGFTEYLDKGREVLQPADRYVSTLEIDAGNVTEEIANRLIDTIAEVVENRKVGLLASAKTRLIDQYRFFLAVYTVPMILHLNYSFSDALADSVIHSWIQKYPKQEFKKGTYEKLKEGFNRKGLCYITSAVCDTLGKSDDCYELTSFRNFRDTYMMQTKERYTMVEEYYRTAPIIVAVINSRVDSTERYRVIWQKYLQPCLRDIEGNCPEACEKRYTRMVRDLEMEFRLSIQ